MDFTALQARLTYLLSYEGWADDNPAPDTAALINRGLVDFAWDTEYNRAEYQFNTVINQAEYTIPAPDFRAISDVAYGTSSILTKTSEGALRQEDPLWFVREAGVPADYLIVRPNVIRLHPKPVAEVEITVRGTRNPAALSGGTDTPACPETFHEAIALRAAVLYGEAHATGDALKRILSYREQYKGHVAALKHYLDVERRNGQGRMVAHPSRHRVSYAGY